jgi:hypothetical protein
MRRGKPNSPLASYVTVDSTVQAILELGREKVRTTMVTASGGVLMLAVTVSHSQSLLSSSQRRGRGQASSGGQPRTQRSSEEARSSRMFNHTEALEPYKLFSRHRIAGCMSPEECAVRALSVTVTSARCEEVGLVWGSENWRSCC